MACILTIWYMTVFPHFRGAFCLGEPVFEDMIYNNEGIRAILGLELSRNVLKIWGFALMDRVGRGFLMAGSWWGYPGWTLWIRGIFQKGI